MVQETIFDVLNHCDLAVEAREMVTRQVGKEIPGVRSFTERLPHAIIHRTEIFNEVGAKQIGKVQGRYTTLEVPDIRRQDEEINRIISDVLALELENIHPLNKDSKILVVGLGNWNITPDALGPRVVNELQVTRHLYQYLPEVIETGMHNVAALAPGVLGITGVETGAIVKGVVDQIQPDLIICIDALAANRVDRLSTTIQVADTGIHPGSGVGNRRAAIDKESMGRPVLAIGVPTVVHAVTLVNNAIELLQTGLQEEGQQGYLNHLPKQQRHHLISKILDPYVGALVVTPKEVDVLIEDIALVVADGLNKYFHHG